MFSDNLGAMEQWATQLDHSFVSIQGPPGAGKTHNAAHLIYALITAGQRVGITATSHVAIAHLLATVMEVFGEHHHVDALCWDIPIGGSGPRVTIMALRSHHRFDPVDNRLPSSFTLRSPV